MPPIDDFKIDWDSKDMQFILDPAKNPVLKQMVENGDVNTLASTLQKYVGQPNTPITRQSLNIDVMDAMSGYLASMNGLSNGLAHALQEQFKDKGLLSSFNDDLEVLNEVYRTMPDKAEKIINTRPENQIKYSDGLYFIKTTDEFHKGLGDDIHYVDVYVVRKINFTFNPNSINGFGFDGETLIFKNLKNGEDSLLVNIHHSKFKPLWFQREDNFEKNKGEITWEEVMVNSINRTYGFNADRYVIHFTTTKGTKGSTDALTFLKSYELI